MFNFLFQGKVGEMMAPIKSPEAQLLIAIHNRQHDKIRELLEIQGVSANSVNERGVRPMHMACQCGDMALVQRLLELGADIVSADKAGNAPLHYASKYGHMELVKMLVSQGAAVERRNGSRLTAYDVATNHVVRQFLLPLQLKAEAGNPEYAVHNPGITSDAPRDFEQYGVPGMGAMGGPHPGPPGHPYGHHNSHGPSTGGASASDAMNAALGALMQPAPSIAPPRPVSSSAPPAGIGGPSPLRTGSYSPPGASFPVSPPRSALPTHLGSMTSPQGTSAPVSHPLPTPGATVRSMATFSGASSHGSSLSSSPPVPAGLAAVPEPSNGCEESSAGSPGTGTSGSQYVGVGGAAEVRPEAPTTADPIAAPTEAPGVTPRLPPAHTPVSAPVEAPTGDSFPFHEVGAGAVTVGKDVPVSEDEDPNAVEVVAKNVVGQSSPSPDVADGAPEKEGTSENGVGVWDGRAENAGVEAEETSSRSPEQSLNANPGAVSVDLSAKFEAQAVVSAPPRPAYSSPGLGSPPLAEQEAPTQAPNPRQAPPAGEKPSKFKPIKADGFHSSASDKALQLRYGHTKIVRDLGAPPTAAQLGPLRPGAMQGGYGTVVPLPAPPMYGSGSYGQVQQPTGPVVDTATALAPPRPPAQYMPHGSPYAQPFGNEQPYAQHYGHVGSQVQPTPAPLPSASSHQEIFRGRAPPPPPPPPHALQHQQGPFVSARVPASMPMTSAPQGDRPGLGAAATGSDGLNSAPPAAVFNIFNPATDRVVAADSTSSSVL